MTEVEETVKFSGSPENTDMILTEDKKPGRRKEAESGVTGNLYDMIVMVQNEVLDYRTVTHEQLLFMTKNDGQARGILNAVKYPVKMSRAKIVPAEGGEEEAEFIKDNLTKSPSEGGMETPLRTVIATMAMAVRDGYKIFEKVWKVKEGKIHLRKLAYRSNETSVPTYEPHGSINGAHQKCSFQNKEVDKKWGLDKIMYYVYNAEENPYRGESDFYPVFYHYDKKHKLYAIAHLAYQLNAVPIRIGKHPKNIADDHLEKFRNSLKSLGTMVAMTCPDECEVESFEGKRSLTEFLALIQHHDGMMSRAFLTQFMNLGQEGRGGSFALSSDQSNLFLMSIMSLLADIATVINTQVIAPLIDWNFGSGKYPTLEFVPFSDTIRSAITSTFYALLAARFPQVSPEFALAMEAAVAEELGLEIDYKAVEQRMEEERQKLLEAEEAEADVIKKAGGDNGGEGGSE